MRRFLVALVAVATLSGPMLAVTGALPARAQNQSGDSLVNVQVGDVLSENNVSVAAAVQAIAQVCGNVGDLNVAAILAGIEDDGNFTGTCTLTSNPTQTVPVTVTQTSGGAAPKP